MQGILKLGSKGKAVEELQILLRAKGYEIPSLGTFENITDKAVKDFQVKTGLTPDGIVGNMTITALKGGDVITYSNSNAIETLSLNKGIGVTDKILSDGEYFKEIFKKDMIFLHHTAGGSNPINSISGWEMDRNKSKGRTAIGTAFVIGRASSSKVDTTYDGKLYRAFHEKYWCYHLGANVKSLEQRSIGIEICNYGGLVKTKDGRFLNYVNKEVLPEHTYSLQKPWRGYQHFEKYTDSQLKTVKSLLHELGNLYGIDVRLKNVGLDWFDFKSDVLSGKPGVHTHVNVRKDKTDLHPQPELIDMLNSL